jgi:hypothetical protein
VLDVLKLLVFLIQDPVGVLHRDILLFFSHQVVVVRQVSRA